jgi:hypothetical protein
MILMGVALTLLPPRPALGERGQDTSSLLSILPTLGVMGAGEGLGMRAVIKGYPSPKNDKVVEA